MTTSKLKLLSVFISITCVFVVWHSPYFINDWLPLTEKSHATNWSDWLADRHFIESGEELPEWNPNNAFGVNYVGRDPFMNMYSFVNISKFIFTNPKSEWMFGIFLYLAIFGFGVYFFLRQNSVSHFVALMGATLIIIYPKWLDDLTHGQGKFITAYCTIPWILLITQKIFTSGPKWVYFVILGVLGGVIFTGSGGWVSIIVSYIIVPYFLYQFFLYLKNTKSITSLFWIKVVVGTICMLTIALALSAYLLLPLLDNLKHSHRTLYSAAPGFGWIDLLGYFFTIDNRLYSSGYYNLPYPMPFEPHMINNWRFYLGVIAIPVLIQTLCIPSLRKKCAFFLFIFLFLLFVNCKIGYVVFPFFNYFEEAMGAQPSQNFIFVHFIFCYTIIFCFFVDYLIKEFRDKEGKAFMLKKSVKALVNILMIGYVIFIAGWLGAKFCVHFIPGLFESIISKSLFEDIRVYAVFQLMVNTYFLDVFFYLILLSAALRLLILYLFKKCAFYKSEKGLALIFVLICADLCLFPKIIYPYTPAIDQRYSHDLEQNKFVKNEIEKTERIGSSYHYEYYRHNMKRLFGIIEKKFGSTRPWAPQEIAKTFKRSSNNYGHIQILCDVGSSYYPVTIGKQSYTIHESLYPEYFFDFEKAMNEGDTDWYRQSWLSIWDPNSKLVDIAAIKYLFWFEPLNDPRYELIKRVPVEDGYIYRNTQALPKAFLAGHLEYFENKEDMIDKMKADSFNPYFTVLTEDKVLFDKFNKFKKGEGKGIKSDVQIKEYQANSILIETSSDKKSILVITDLFFPYWKVTINKVQDAIYRVNGIYRGIVVPPGKNEIRLTFKNPHFHKGLLISGLMLAVVCMFFCIYLVRNKLMKN